MTPTDGEGDEVVSGTETQTQVRGGVITVTSTMNDPRASGTGTFLATFDGYSQVVSEWATFRLEHAAGIWEGPCTGAASDGGSLVVIDCWLVGSGGYTGYTYYRVHRAITGRTATFDVEGAIFPGSPPETIDSEVPGHALDRLDRVPDPHRRPRRGVWRGRCDVARSDAVAGAHPGSAIADPDDATGSNSDHAAAD